MARYNQLNAAASRKDIATVMALHTPDYVHVTVKGVRMSAAELRKNVERLFQVATKIKGRNEIQKVTVNGTTAILSVKNHAEAIMTNPYDRTEKRPMISDSVSEDTWVKGNKGWLLKQSRDLK